MRGYQSLLRASAVPWFIILCCCLFSRDGIDHGQYLKWASATVSGDIQLLENKQQITSVTGIPFSPWSAGPGLLIAPFYLTMSIFSLQQGAGLVTGYVCVAIFWLCLFQAVKEISNARHAALACFFLAIGTPVGYYCSSISSETYALAPTAYLFLQAARILKKKNASTWGIAGATAVLLMIRSFLAVFAWPTLFAGLFLNRSQMSRAKFIVATSLMIGLSIIQIAMTNYWMTGEALHSPYSFGDESFESIDGSAPFFTHILFDSFHGLVPSHPLVALGILSIPLLIGILVSNKHHAEATIWSLFLIAIAANIYVQSCWFYWWLAAPSFGMRGLVLCSIPAVGSLMRLRFLLETTSPRTAKTLLVFILLMTMYGWFHLEVGPTNCDSFLQLESKLLFGLSNWKTVSGLAGTAIGSICGLLAFRSRKLATSRFEKVSIAILVAWFVGHYVRLFFSQESNWTFFVITSSIVVATLWISYSKKIQTTNFTSAAFRFAAPTMLIAFAFLSFSTIPKMQQPTESALVFNRPDARRAYLTLREIPRFRDQANELYEFFVRTQDPNWVEKELPRPIQSSTISPVAHIEMPDIRNPANR